MGRSLTFNKRWQANRRHLTRSGFTSNGWSILSSSNIVEIDLVAGTARIVRPIRF
jgi:hypothetical protein